MNFTDIDGIYTYTFEAEKKVSQRSNTVMNSLTH